jgi:hypothetical protein
MWRALAPSLIGIAFVACTLEPMPGTTDGQTTTTYGNTDPDDGDPTDLTDDGPSDETSGPDPSDSGPDPSDSGPDPSTTTDPDPSDSGFPFDLIPDGEPNGAACQGDADCNSGNCYVLPFLGGFCGECNEDADCFGGGCTAPNPFDSSPSVCNMGQLGGGCESDDVCSGDLSCSNTLDLLGLIQLNTCGSCIDDSECANQNQICAAIVDLSEFAGYRDCIDPNSLPLHSYCELDPEGFGAGACVSGICSVVDVMGLAEIGACGECIDDSHCNGGVCVAGELVLDTAELFGSTCQ